MPPAVRFAPAFLVLCSACLPIPERINDTPAIRGQIVRAGTPVSHAPIALADRNDDASCAAPTLRAVTDAAGMFSFPRRTHWATGSVLGAHTSQRWSLCLDAEGKTLELARASSHRMGGGPSTVRLRCELSRLADSTRAEFGTSPWNDPLRESAPCLHAAEP